MGRQADIGFVCQTPPPANLVVDESISKLRIMHSPANDTCEFQFTKSTGDKVTFSVWPEGLHIWDPDTNSTVWDSRHHGLIESTRDWDTLMEGTWYFTPDSLSGAHAPTAIGYKYGMVQVLKDKGTMWTQIAYPHQPNQTTSADRWANVMMRQNYGATWSPWRVI